MQETVNKVLYHSLCNVIWGCGMLGLHGEGTRSLKGLTLDSSFSSSAHGLGHLPELRFSRPGRGQAGKQGRSDSPEALLTHRGACSPQRDYDISLRLPHRPQAIPEKGEFLGKSSLSPQSEGVCACVCVCACAPKQRPSWSSEDQQLVWRTHQLKPASS